MEWIIIANRMGADIYELNQTKSVSIRLLKNIPNPQGRLKNKELYTGKPGQNNSPFRAYSPHNLTAERSPHEEVTEHFVRDLSQFIKQEEKAHQNLHIRVVAEAKVLGEIRAHFDKFHETKQIEWINKDLAKIPKSKWPDLLHLPKNGQRFGVVSSLSA